MSIPSIKLVRELTAKAKKEISKQNKKKARQDTVRLVERMIRTMNIALSRGEYEAKILVSLSKGARGNSLKKAADLFIAKGYTAKFGLSGGDTSFLKVIWR